MSAEQGDEATTPTGITTQPVDEVDPVMIEPDDPKLRAALGLPAAQSGR